MPWAALHIILGAVAHVVRVVVAPRAEAGGRSHRELNLWLPVCARAQCAKRIWATYKAKHPTPQSVSWPACLRVVSENRVKVGAHLPARLDLLTAEEAHRLSKIDGA